MSISDPAPVRSEPAWVTRLRAALAHGAASPSPDPLRPAVGARPAAVLILLGGDTDPEMLFVERAATLRKHPGQIAFPGGARDPGDVDLAETALREAYEETGVDRSGIDVLGSMSPAHVSVSGFDVTPVVGWWHTPSPIGVADPREVASVEMVRIADLANPAHRARVHHPAGYVGPAFEAAGHLIWGLTAHLVDGVLQLGGWSRPWDRRRTLPIPGRYLTDHSSTGGPDAH